MYIAIHPYIMIIPSMNINGKYMGKKISHISHEWIRMGTNRYNMLHIFCLFVWYPPACALFLVSKVHPWTLETTKAHCEKAKGWRIPPAFALCAHSPSLDFM